MVNHNHCQDYSDKMMTRSRRCDEGRVGGTVNAKMIQLYSVGRLRQELEIRGLPTVGKKSELRDRLYEALTRPQSSASGGVNIHLIQLYDVGRLKQELESRGLSTVGKKPQLADRLYDAVTGQIPAAVAPTPLPKPKVPKSEANQEPHKSPGPVNKSPKAPKRPRNPEDANVAASETETPAETNESPKKKVKVEVVEEAVGENKQINVKQEPELPEPEATSSKAPVATEQSPSAQEFTEDVPLLSLLAPKKIKMEVPPENDEVGHEHGTGQEIAQNQAKQVPVVDLEDIVDVHMSPDCSSIPLFDSSSSQPRVLLPPLLLWTPTQ